MTKSEQLWGGRFTEKPDETFAAFNNSLGFDQRLLAADIRASIAHANGLLKAGVLSGDENQAIVDGLQKVLANSHGKLEGAEDVHSYIESSIVALIGDTGKKLHTGRSRNDQVATAFRLWLRDEIDAMSADLHKFRSALVAAAKRHSDAVIPGYTHLQRAQPILWPHWCLAYFEMFARDAERFSEVRRRVNVLPLGSAALAGTGFPIDRDAVAAELGFERVSANSLDAVSDRDFAVEFVAACALSMVHLSRFAEDLIIYATAEFGFITLSDAVSTGSSLMPQKKNPDALELIRGKAGRVIGHQMALLATIKGLPLAYNKDMQEDKEAVFDSADTLKISLCVAAIVLDNLTVNEPVTRKAAEKGYLNATDLADYFVKRSVPFRVAHDAVGKIVLYAVKEGKELGELTLDEFRKFLPDVDDDVFEALNLENTLNSKSQTGGTSRTRVAEALKEAERTLEIS
jgi:argininosuccinate lyase